MAEKEARMAAIRKQVREISNPILARGRLQTADLRGELKQLSAKISEKEAPYRQEAAQKTQSLRDEASQVRESYIALKNAIYNSVAPTKQEAPAQGQ